MNLFQDDLKFIWESKYTRKINKILKQEKCQGIYQDKTYYKINN